MRLVAVIGIVGIVGLEAYAVHQGINGAILGVAFAAIAGIITWVVRGRVEQRRRR